MRERRVPHDVSELREAMRRFVAIRRSRVPREHDPLAILHREGFSAYFFGGTIRDVVLHGPWVQPRDIDVVVSGAGEEELKQALSRWIVRTTRFGGFRLETAYEVLDVWPTSQTWAFREFPLIGSEAGDLPKTTPFTIEAAVVSTSPRGGYGREIFEQRFIESVARREIDLNFDIQFCETLTFVRAIAMAMKTDFSLSSRLVDRLVSIARRVDIEELAAVAKSHYGRRSLPVPELSRIVAIVNEHHRRMRKASLRLPRPTQMQFQFCKPTYLTPVGGRLTPNFKPAPPLAPPTDTPRRTGHAVNRESQRV